MSHRHHPPLPPPRRERARWALLYATSLVISTSASPAFGQARPTCTTEALECSDCSYDTCVTDDGLYFEVDGGRIECDGYDCGQAIERLQRRCCGPSEEALATQRKKSDGCALTLGTTALGPRGWLAAGLLAAFFGLRRRGTPRALRRG